MEHFNPMFAGVTHDFGWCIKTHGLRIQQCTGEGLGMEFLDPGRNVNEMGEACGMAFRKTIGAEAFDLLEAAFGEFLLVTAPHHAAYEHFLEIVDGADIFESRHGAAQAIGFIGSELCRHNGQFHRLFLKQRNAHRLAEHGDEFIFCGGVQ